MMIIVKLKALIGILSLSYIFFYYLFNLSVLVNCDRSLDTLQRDSRQIDHRIPRRDVYRLQRFIEDDNKYIPSLGKILKKRAVSESQKKGTKLAKKPTKQTTTTTTTTTAETVDESELEAKSAESTTSSSNIEDSEKEYEGDYRDEEEEKEKETTKTITTTTTTTKKPTLQSEGPKSTTNIRGTKKPAKTLKQAEKEHKQKQKVQKTTTPATTSESYNEMMEEGEENDDINVDGKILIEDSDKSRNSKRIENPTVKAISKPVAKLKLPFIKPKNESACTPEAYLEFPQDLIGNKWRARGLIVIHIAVVCYMFYSLALVCEKYFMPSLEEFSQRLGLSEDVAGATLMSAGSSAPELFTALLGVFVAKGDVGTGTIVGSAVFNILFVIGICAFVSTTATQLAWWPVLRDSLFYTLTVLVLIMVTAFESATMIALYGLYIVIMKYNDQLKDLVTKVLLSNPNTAKLINAASSIDGSDDVFGLSMTSHGAGCSTNMTNVQQTSSLVTGAGSRTVEEDSIYLAALLKIMKQRRLFSCRLRFQAAAWYIITKRQHKMRDSQRAKSPIGVYSDEVNYFEQESDHLTSKGQKKRMEAYAKSSTISKNKFSIVSKDDYEFWHRPPEEGENYYLWMAKIPVNYALHYTIPDCTIYPDRYLIAFIMSIIWTAFFSYINVWMVTLIGYTLGIPDSVMGVTFLAAGTSVPDCYSSIHAARNGMADMAVSNSIGSNVFDILIGLAVPWFIQSAIYPGVIATINSRGIVYSVILLFLSLIVTIYLMNKHEWTLKPRLGLALLIAYALFILLTCMLEFNLFGYVNPPPCIVGINNH